MTLEPWNSSLRRRSKSTRNTADFDSPIGCAIHCIPNIVIYLIIIPESRAIPSEIKIYLGNTGFNSERGAPLVRATARTQDSQFTSLDFTGALKDADIRISMDGRGRCMDNIFIERLWRSLKYEAVYLHELTEGFKAERVIGEWIGFYNPSGPIPPCLAKRRPRPRVQGGLWICWTRLAPCPHPHRLNKYSRT